MKTSYKYRELESQLLIHVINYLFLKIELNEACTTPENPGNMVSIIIGHERNLAAYFKTPFDKSFRERDQMFRGLDERKLETRS